MSSRLPLFHSINIATWALSRDRSGLKMRVIIESEYLFLSADSVQDRINLFALGLTDAMIACGRFDNSAECGSIVTEILLYLHEH